MKRYSALLFSVKEQVLENQKTSESFWYKEEEEEVQRDSRLVKDCMNKCKKYIEMQIKALLL